MTVHSIRSSRPIYRLILASTWSTDQVLNDLLGPAEGETLNILQALTDDRLSGALGRQNGIPLTDYVAGGQEADAVMAAFLHPWPQGSRFSGAALGAWYAAFEPETALRDAIERHTRCLRAAKGLFPATLRLQAVSSTAELTLLDLRGWTGSALSDPAGTAHQFGETVKRVGVDGLLYCGESARTAERVVVFRPRRLIPLQRGELYEITWDSNGFPSVYTLSDLKASPVEGRPA